MSLPTLDDVAAALGQACAEERLAIAGHDGYWAAPYAVARRLQVHHSHVTEALTQLAQAGRVRKVPDDTQRWQLAGEDIA